MPSDTLVARLLLRSIRQQQGLLQGVEEVGRALELSLGLTQWWATARARTVSRLA